MRALGLEPQLRKLGLWQESTANRRAPSVGRDVLCTACSSPRGSPGTVPSGLPVYGLILGLFSCPFLALAGTSIFIHVQLWPHFKDQKIRHVVGQRFLLYKEQLSFHDKYQEGIQKDSILEESVLLSPLFHRQEDTQCVCFFLLPLKGKRRCSSVEGAEGAGPPLRPLWPPPNPCWAGDQSCPVLCHPEFWKINLWICCPRVGKQFGWGTWECWKASFLNTDRHVTTPQKVRWALLRAYKGPLSICSNSNKDRKDSMLMNCHYDKLRRWHPGFTQRTRRPQWRAPCQGTTGWWWVPGARRGTPQSLSLPGWVIQVLDPQDKNKHSHFGKTKSRFIHSPSSGELRPLLSLLQRMGVALESQTTA